MIITITPSTTQILTGIPQSIILATDVPSSIFYTIDGSIPTIHSNIYVGGGFNLPTDAGQSVTLNVFATNGTISATASQEYFGTLVGDRRPRATVTNFNQTLNSPGNLFPFGDLNSNIPATYGNTGGITVDDANLPQIPDGYDGSATKTPAGYTNLPLSSYDIVYSTTDFEGRTGYGIGNLPATVSVVLPAIPPENSTVGSRLFNPRSLVIYQNESDPPVEGMGPVLMRSYYAAENPETVKTGALLFNTGFEGQVISGSLVRREVNANDQTITYYYRDSLANQWIISKQNLLPCQV